MKKFLLHIVGLFIGTLLIMTILDFAYTKVYENAVPRTKFQMFRNMEGKKADYIFLGSSRVENAIIPAVIKKRTGKEAVNLGFKGSRLEDIYTMLKLLKAYHIQTDKVFIQVDYIFNLVGNSNMMQYELVPFIRDNNEIRNHFRDFPDSKALYYVPFYRYCANDYKVGFREVFSNVTGRKTNVLSERGYKALQHSDVDKTYTLPKTIHACNTTYDSIRNYCRKNKIDVVFFCSPFWKASQHLDYIAKLKTKIPDLRDYSAMVADSLMFKNNCHLNDKGARFFTERLSADLLENN